MSIQSQLVEFRSSVIHGSGGFVACPIPAGTLLLEYVGERISKEESLRRCEAGNPWIFDLDGEQDLDGNVDWNPARFLNHSCTANCEAEEDEGRIWIRALTDIPAGAELTFNYGYELADWEDHPCQCGAYSCVGFIVAQEYHDTIRARLVQRREAAEIVRGGR